MRILMPSIVDPAHGTGGAWTVTRGLILALRELFPDAEIRLIPVPESSPLRHRFRQGTSILKSFVGPYPAKVAFARSGAMREHIRNAGPMDLVVLNGSDLLWTLPHLPPSTPVLVVAHNLEHRIFADQTARFHRLARREALRLREFELSGFERAGNVLFLSTEECSEVCREYPKLHAAVLPPLFPPSFSQRPAQGKTVELAFLANLKWWPNQDGLQWFLREIWPAVNSHVNLHLVGPGSRQMAKGQHRVQGHGVVKDLRQVWEKCHLMIAPLRRGAGVRVKIAEALHNGTPVLATSAAAKGLSGGKAVRIVDSVQGWIDFLNGEDLWPWAESCLHGRPESPYAIEAGAAILRRFLKPLSLNPRLNAQR